MGKCGTAEKEGDHGQVREARGEGFVPSLLTGHPQHGPEDLHIGHNNENKTSKKYRGTKYNKSKFSEVRTRAGELEDLGNFTEELIHSIALAEWH